MDTNNLDKWWYGLPGNTRQAIGNDGIWEKLDMPSRSALHRYSRLRIYGTAKDRDEERTLLNEIACGLGRFAVCATKEGESSQLGTDCARLVLRRFLAFLKGERSGKEIIDVICNNQQTER